MHTSNTPRLRAFTLIELLVVLAIIALIVGIVLVAMGGVRSSVRRTESSNALRQMVAAYDAYSTDHNKRLMPGFVTAAQVTTLNIFALREDRVPHTDIDSQGYVWRLAPYLSNKWETMFVDYGSKRLNAQLAKEYEADVFGPGSLTVPADQLGIASIPSFGLNSIFLGGDAVHGGAVATPYSPWNGAGNEPIAAVRYSEVKQPAHMIVFAPVKQANLAQNPVMQFPDVEFGYVELRPPFITLTAGGIWDDRQWEIADDGSSVVASGGADYASGGGMPVSRWGGGALPVAHLDGSVTTETLTSLSNNMTLWSPSAKGHYIEE